MRRLALAALAAVVLTFGAKADPAFFYSTPFASRLADDSKAGDYSKIKTVAIVSTVGQRMEFFRDNWVSNKFVADIRDWKLDDLVEAALRRTLAKRFTIVDAPFDRAAMPAAGIGWFSGNKEKLQRYFASHSAPVDAYILVRPYADEDFTGLYYEYASRYIDGRLGGSFSANYMLEVVDAKTFEYIGKAAARIQFRGDSMPMYAGLDVGGMEFPKAAPSPETLATSRPIFEMLMSMSLLETIRAMNFGVDLPPVGGRTTYPTPKGQERHRNTHTVAVVSAIADQLELAYPGFFPNVLKSDNHIPIADMNLDTEVEKVAREVLARRFTVKDITVDRAALAQVRLFDKDEKRIDTIPGLPVANDIDVYLVFVKTPGNQPDPWHGTGIVSDWRVRPTGAAVFTYYQIAVVDPRTHKVLGWYRGQPSLAWPRDVPWRNVEPALWPGEKATALSPDQHSKIEEVLRAEIDDSVPETLLIMGLTNQSISFHSFLNPED